MYTIIHYYMVYAVRENIENMEKSGENEKLIAQVSEKPGKPIFSQSEVLKFWKFVGEHAPRLP